MRFSNGILLAAVSAALVGCNLTGAMKPEEPVPAGQASTSTFTPSTDAGVEVVRPQDPAGLKMKSVVAKRASAGAFGMARPDPFALTTLERGFETKQEAERVLSVAGGFSTFVEQKPETDVALMPEEPQPYRRLSGVVVGDSVLAILEEQGKAPIIITPGMTLPGTRWKVVSIDQDKAVLRRPGNVRPTQVIVRLETPRYGTGETGGGFPGGGSGFPGGPGRPGGPGGAGFPGGPGGPGPAAGGEK